MDFCDRVFLLSWADVDMICCDSLASLDTQPNTAAL